MIRWKNRAAMQVSGVFIEPTGCTVGKNQESGGILYRPYDGKIRPKSWAMFDAGTCYWKNKAEFLDGLKI